jgi:hypothetical protein
MMEEIVSEALVTAGTDGGMEGEWSGEEVEGERE